MQTSSLERTKISNNLQKVVPFFDRTMPKTPEESRLRRRIGGALLAALGIITPFAIQSHNDQEAHVNGFASESFSGDTDIQSVNLFDNPYNPDTSSIVRSSPDTGILGLSNKIAVIPAEIDQIKTPSGVNEICYGETFRNDAGDIIERCWLEVATRDIKASISELNDQGQHDPLLTSIRDLESVYLADDLASAQREQ